MPTNKFHYIWMGRMPTGRHENNFKSGPNALAQELKDYTFNTNRLEYKQNPQDQEIIMWVPEDLISSIKESGILDPTITIKPVEDLFNSAKYLSLEEREKLKTTVNTLGEHHAYVSQKDILSAAILEEHGGYFLDTTTTVDSVELLISKQPEDVWFPRVTQEASKIYNNETVILPEVWALYNPTPGGGTFRGMMNSYAQRCQFYFSEPFEGSKVDLKKTENIDVTTKSGYDLYGNKSQGSGRQIMMIPELRDKLIGETVIFSLLDGLNQTKGPLTDERMRELSSLSQQTENEAEKIYDMGIEKFHKGMWRNAAVADTIDHSLEEKRVLKQETRQQQSEPALLTTNMDALLPLPSQDREHLFKVKPSNSNIYKLKYQSLKGDLLKTQILRDFVKNLTNISDIDMLNHFVADFKKSNDYKVLSSGQGLATKVFLLETTSQQTVEKLVEKRTAEIKSHKSNIL